MSKKIPRFKSDAEAAKFLEQDLSEYMDRRQFKPMRFEFAPKDRPVTVRFTALMVQSLKKLAGKRHMPYQRLIRMAVEDYLQRAA